MSVIKNLMGFRNKRGLSDLLVVIGVTILSTLLMLYQLDKKSLWVDELFTVTNSQSGTFDIIIGIMRGDPHPPLQYLALHYFTQLTGNHGVFNSRLLFVLFGILSVIAFYPMIRYVLTREAALISLVLFGITPFLIMYSRMARYYSLVLFLSIVSFYFFFRIISHGKEQRMTDQILFILVSTLLLYTYIPAVAVVAAQICVLIYKQWEEHPDSFCRLIVSTCKSWKLLIYSFVIVLLFFSVWITGMYFLHTSTTYGSLQVLNSFSQFIARFFVPFYVYSIGATVYPWTWYGLTGLVVCLGLFLYSIYHFYKRKDYTLLILFIVPLVIVNCILQVFNTSFIDIPQRGIFMLPFFIAIIGYAISKIKINLFKILIILIIILVSGISLSNYYDNAEFIDPMYIVPAKEIVSDLQASTTPSDVIITQGSTSIGYYWTRGMNYSPTIPIYTIIQDTPDILEKINAASMQEGNGNSTRYILLIENTDTHGEFTKEWSLVINSLVSHGYSQKVQVNYVPTDPTYRKMKEFVLKRLTFEYRFEEKIFSKT